MRAVVVCVSVSHGNTGRVAGVIAEELGAPAVEPEAAAGLLGDCDVLGVGSGIFAMAFHPRLRRFADDLPDGPAWCAGLRVLDERIG
jgi:flavodoxin